MNKNYKRTRINQLKVYLIGSIFILVTCILCLVFHEVYIRREADILSQANASVTEEWLRDFNVKQAFLTPNEYSRPQTKLDPVTAVVIHYTANPGTSAMANRNYFENLKDTKEAYASSHFIIGLDGEIVQCIPLSEQPFANKTRNNDTISIECCHPDDTGKFNEKTYQTLLEFVARICKEYHLGEDQILRHYDITGKNCPKYYVEHEEAFIQMKQDIMEKSSHD